LRPLKDNGKSGSTTDKTFRITAQAKSSAVATGLGASRPLPLLVVRLP
jgi:hypothetical protein